MRRHRGLLLALALGAATLALQYRRHQERVEGYDRWALPAFDAYVYMAMADHPGVFTLSPWGERVATPWLVHVLPLRSTAEGFLLVTLGGLLASSGLLYLFLRRLGHGEWISLLAVPAFLLAEPASESVSYVFLADPLALLLEVALLLVLESGAPLALLALLGALSALTKEMLLLFLPAVYFVLRDREGDRRALLKLAAAALPALAGRLVLAAWTPSGHSSLALLGPEGFWLAVYRILAGWPDWWRFALLGGILPLAALGACRRAARPYLLRYGYLLALTLALPFAVAVNTGDAATVPFYALDVRRVLLFALPVLLPLALVALDRVLPHLSAPAAAPSLPRGAGWAAAAATLACLLGPLAVFDSYRHVDLGGPRDGRLLLALCRQSLAFARRLERGKPVDYEVEARRFSPQRSYPQLLERMRWFLRDGWGRMPHYGMGAVVMQAREASVLLPCLRPADWNLVLVLSAPAAARVRVAVNGMPLGEAAAGSQPVRSKLAVPAAALFRGDNLLVLEAEQPEPQVRLHDLMLRPLSLM